MLMLEDIMKEFENVVIGTGMGGGVIGYALAKAGKEVLFCEQGKNFNTPSQLVHDHFAEEIKELDIDFNELKKNIHYMVDFVKKFTIIKIYLMKL